MHRGESISFTVPFRQGDWNSTVRAFQTVNALLQIGFTVLWASESCENFDRGDFVIPVEEKIEDHDSERAVEAFVDRIAAECGISLREWDDAMGLKAYALKEPRIAIYHGAGADMAAFSTCLGKLGFTHVHYVTEKHVVNEVLRGYDVLIMPGGDSSTIVTALGSDGCKRINEFVYAGGAYIGACAGAFLPVKPSSTDRPEGPNREEYQRPHKFLELLEYKILNNFWRREIVFPVWSYFEHGDLIRVFPFVGDPTSTVRLRVVMRDHPVMFGYDEFIDIHMAGPVIDAGKDVEVLAEFHSPTARTEYGLPEEKAWQIARGRAAIVAGHFGKGKLILFGPHPEEFYEATHPLVGNALFFLTCSGPSKVDIPTLKKSSIRLRSPAEISPRSTPSVAMAENRSIELLDLLMSKVRHLDFGIRSLKDRAVDLIPTRASDWFLYTLIPLIGLSELKLSELREDFPKLLASYTYFEHLRRELQSYRMSSRASNDFHTDLSVKASNMVADGVAAYMQEAESSVETLPLIIDKAAASIDDILMHVKKMRSAADKEQNLDDLKEVLGRKIMSILFLLNGGLHFMVPWYDGQYGYVEDFETGLGQSGFLAPLMQLAFRARRISIFSKFASIFVSH